ncbi:hypothetical protein C8R43DRAFT_949093 [Mycena crocata]|nr:hypothetical protein C8R43DRAFT_949093 [Mycena crocata]
MSVRPSSVPSSSLSRVLAAEIAVAFICTLPPEIAALVFCIVCSHETPTLRSFGAARARLSLVCRMWRAIVNDIPSMWRNIVVDTQSTAMGVDAFLRFSQRRPISVAFFNYVRPFAPVGLETLLTCANLLLPSISRWDALKISSNDSRTVDALTNLFLHVSPHRITFLSLVCCAPGTSRLATLYQSGPLLFSGQLQRMRRLDLYAVALPWVLLPPMPALEMLSLRALSRAAWPTFTQYAALLSTAPHLEHVALKSVGCAYGVPPSAVLHLPQVLRLDITFQAGEGGDNTSLFSLLEIFVLPNLQSVDVFFMHPANLEVFLATRLRFDATHVGIGGRYSSEVELTGGLRNLGFHFPKVTSLSLLQAAPSFLRALGSSCPSGLPLFPSLRLVALHVTKWSHVLTMANARKVLGATQLELECRLPESGQIYREDDRQNYEAVNALLRIRFLHWVRVATNAFVQKWLVLAPLLCHHV